MTSRAHLPTTEDPCTAALLGTGPTHIIPSEKPEAGNLHKPILLLPTELDFMGPHTCQPLKSRALPHCWAPVPPHITSAEKPETGNPHLGYSPSGDIRLLGYPPSAIHLPRYSPSGIFTSWDIRLLGCSPSGIFASGVFTFWDVHLLQYSPSGIFTFRIFTFWISTFWDIHVPGYSPSGTCTFWDMRLLGYSSSGMFTFWGTHPWAQAFGIFAFWDIRFRDIQALGCSPCGIFTFCEIHLPRS